MSINVALAMPTLFSSSTRPLTLIVERVRELAIRIASSSEIGTPVDVSGFEVSGFGVSTGDGSGVGDVSGVGVGAVVATGSVAGVAVSVVDVAAGGAAGVSVAVVIKPPP